MRTMRKTWGLNGSGIYLTLPFLQHVQQLLLLCLLYLLLVCRFIVILYIDSLLPSLWGLNGRRRTEEWSRRGEHSRMWQRYSLSFVPTLIKRIAFTSVIMQEFPHVFVRPGLVIDSNTSRICKTVIRKVMEMERKGRWEREGRRPFFR